MKRHDVVYEKEYAKCFASVLGRINRILSDGMVEVIYVDREVKIQHFDELEVMENYRGYWESGYWYSDGMDRFKKMPTLRKLKQGVAPFEKTIWKRNRKKMNKNP